MSKCSGLATCSYKRYNAGCQTTRRKKKNIIVIRLIAGFIEGGVHVIITCIMQASGLVTYIIFSNYPASTV